MGRVVALLKVFPDESANLEELKQRIRDAIKPTKIDEEPVAFGFVALKVTVIMEDAAGSGDIEEKVKAIPGVSEAEITDMGRI